MYKITIGIDGMMCSNCEKHVTDKFESIDGIKKVRASAKDKEAVVTSNTVIDEAEAKKLVEECGYKFLSYKCEEKVGLFG